jgi:hypothetical protein
MIKRRILGKRFLAEEFDNCCSGEDPSVGITIGQQLPQSFSAKKPTGVAFSGLRERADSAADEEPQMQNHASGTSMTGDSIGQLDGPNHSALDPLAYLQRTALDRLDAGDLLFKVDFRSIYATILDHWMRAPSERILGRSFSSLPLLG